MLSQSRPAKIKSFNYQLSAALKYITAEIWNTKGTQNNTCRRSDGGSGMIGSHVARLILYKSFVVCISNRDQRCLRQKTLFHNGFSEKLPILLEKGSFYPRTAIRSKHTMIALIYCSFMTHFMTKKIWKKRNVTLDPRHTLVSSVVQAKLLDCCYGFMSKFVTSADIILL